MIKIYFDTCCLNRPFDNQTQVRIHLEAEAVLGILVRIKNGEWSWVGSEVLIDEIEQIPDMQRLSRVRVLSDFVQEIIEIGEKEVKRAKELLRRAFRCLTLAYCLCGKRKSRCVFID